MAATATASGGGRARVSGTGGKNRERASQERSERERGEMEHGVGVLIRAGGGRDVASGLQEATSARLCLLAEVEERKKEKKGIFDTPLEKK